MKKRFIGAIDLVTDSAGAILVRTAIAGRGKPDILSWSAGSDTFSQAESGTVSHDASVIFIRVGAGGALVSIDDQDGSEKPFIIPPNYWREIVLSDVIPAGARIVAKNLTAGENFSDLIVEVR